MVRFSLERLRELDRSRMMKPRPPSVKRKLEASPSMMYWPLTLYCMKATGRGLPNSSVEWRGGGRCVVRGAKKTV